ncbi:Reactive mitochondrial oxygen species modulator 1 family protein [Babesia bovis T2Bo]|uniref:Reactive mitochondrial oxygen species modulator 1 family protein n=1 Tax=Babesia bovis T2Bo TaxID=484906 RepID=UPI001C35F4B5|nr:Reactive mitochondrial oxygen species modulator 1 family protein [Babesia bovis T2Bo]EDO08475.2 Reactive mitochondrial oxygen species modulator 1 family protein [Babesia bovis T2Bo]
MWQYISGGSGTTTVPPMTSKYDDKVPPPPAGGAFVPPPRAPRGVKLSANKNEEFKGFSAPPKVTDYSNADYSAYTLSETYDDTTSKGHGFLNNILSNPRARNCWASVKMGFKMGGAVGGIFGGITGVYTSMRHRNLMVLPISVIGGAISFGFFLGCGMVVRC